MQTTALSVLIGLVAFALIYHLWNIATLKSRMDSLLNTPINKHGFIKERTTDVAQRDVQILAAFMKAHLFDLLILFAVLITLLIVRYV